MIHKPRITYQLITFILCLGAYLIPAVVFAKDFKFDYDVNYNVTDSGKTDVHYNITVTNLVTNYYAQNFTLTLSSERIDNIRAQDPAGAIQPQVSKSNGQTLVTLPFNIKSVGIGKQFSFDLMYESWEITSRKGRIWEIIIPGFDKTEEIDSYRIHLNTPRSFGEPAYLSPPQTAQGSWTLEDLNGGGITAAYGDFQVFDFNLEYHLANTTNRKEIREITLPPDTSYQKIVINRLSEKPLNVVVDKDRNWLARYELAPQQNLKIFAEGQAIIYVRALPKTQTVLSESDRKLYTSPQPFWEQTAAIKQKAAELKTPEAIYNWVVHTLKYDYSRVEREVERLGADTVFRNPNSAVCMEFADLFIALARSAGIPAREVHGYAFTKNSRLQPLSLVTDVLHAWPEYYDDARQIWIPVDPTWENTTRGVDYFSKLDFNHFAFAILGEKSDYPYPAGSFRTETSGKDVYVDFAQEATWEEPRIEADLNLAKIFVSGTQVQGNLRIKNTGRTLFTTSDISAHWVVPPVFQIDSPMLIPPEGYIDIPFTLKNPQIFKTAVGTFLFKVGDKEYTQYVQALPFYVIYRYQLLGLGIVVGFSVLIRYARRTKNKYS